MQCSIYFFTKNAVDFEATEMFYAKAKISCQASFFGGVLYANESNLRYQ